jgi:hypothetical protein
MFLVSQTLREKLTSLMEQSINVCIPVDNDEVRVSAVVNVLLTSLENIHSLWRVKSYLSQNQIQSYTSHVNKFRQMWTVLKWKPTVWVHWLCAHSVFYVSTHHSMYLFSSIPTEHRHQGFKRDLRVVFHGYKYKNPRVSSSSLTRSVNLDALDQALRLLPPL